MKTLYFWDLHWSSYFVDFVRKYDDWFTKFVSLWDLFDRGPDSYKIYLEVKRLYSQWLFDMVLGNHDLFFIFWIWLSEQYNWFLLPRVKNNRRYSDYVALWKEAYYSLQLFWGESTLDSILERYSWIYWSKKSNLFEDEQIKRLNEVAEFLYQFNIYKLDENKNLLVHWWLPVLNDWSVVSIQVDWKMTSGWVELLEACNKWYRDLDFWLIIALVTWASSEYQDFNILYDMKKNNLLKDSVLMDKMLSKIDTASHFLPMWYLNDLYFSHEKIARTIKDELVKENITALIVWHCGNKVPSEWYNDLTSDYWSHLLSQKNTIIRLDRNFLQVDCKFWNFGFILLDKKWKYVDIWDSFEKIEINRSY